MRAPMKKALLVLTLLVGCAPTRMAGRTGAALCPEGFEHLASGACLALPPNQGPDTKVVMFLHGMYNDEWPQQEYAVEARVAKAVTGAGFALLVPRGELGLCDWSHD